MGKQEWVDHRRGRGGRMDIIKTYTNPSNDNKVCGIHFTSIKCKNNPHEKYVDKLFLKD